MQMSDSVGLTINIKKSVLTPNHKVKYLGMTLNSVKISATLPTHHNNNIQEQSLLKKDSTLHDLASFIGLDMTNSAVNLNSPEVQMPPDC